LALTVVVNSVSFQIPEPADTGYGTALDAYLKALATAFLPLGGGTNSLTAELDLGASFGLKSIYFKSATVNPASAGQVRLAKTDSVKFRNNANGADLSLAIDTADQLTWGGANVTGNPMLDASTTAARASPTATVAIVVFGTASATRTTPTPPALAGTPSRPARAGTTGFTASVCYANAPTHLHKAQVFKNAAAGQDRRVIAPGVANQDISGHGQLTLAAGDIIDIRTSHGNAAPQNLERHGTSNYFTLKRVPT
jgi:hypothetical protein